MDSSLGAGHFATLAGIDTHGVLECPGKGLEQRLSLVVAVLPRKNPSVQVEFTLHCDGL